MIYLSNSSLSIIIMSGKLILLVIDAHKKAFGKKIFFF